MQRRQSGFLQRYPVTGQGAVSTNWNAGDSIWTSGNTFYCEVDWTLAQVAQGDCGVSVLGDTQKPAGHSPGQPTLGGPAWAGGVGPGDLQRSLPTSTILWCCMDWNPFIRRSQDRFSSGREAVRSGQVGKGCIWKGNTVPGLCSCLAKTRVLYSVVLYTDLSIHEAYSNPGFLLTFNT